MRSMLKIVALVGVTTITVVLSISMAVAYEEGETGEAIVEGKIAFKGIPPPPKLFDLSKYPNIKFCSQFDSDGKGNRTFRGITVNNGNLQDVIVYIRNISKGKPFIFNGTDVKINGCRFLVQGGSSTFVGVVVNGAEIRVLNEDIDPSDPQAVNGVLHNPHGLEVEGGSSYNMIKTWPQILKGSLVTRQVKFRKPGSVMFLYCQQHVDFELAWFYPVENPYYAIVGSEGTYSIDKVPVGKYSLVAWHPILGKKEKEVVVGAAGKVIVNFEFSK